MAYVRPTQKTGTSYTQKTGTTTTQKTATSSPTQITSDVSSKPVSNTVTLTAAQRDANRRRRQAKSGRLAQKARTGTRQQRR